MITAQNIMAPVGTPKAAHLGAPEGIPTGPSAADLQQQLAALQEQMARLLAVQGPQKEEIRESITYYHQNPGSTVTVIRKDAKNNSIPETVAFINGEIETADPVLQDFLDEIADIPGSPVYTRKDHPKQDPATAAAAADVVASASKTIAKLGAEAGVLR